MKPYGIFQKRKIFDDSENDDEFQKQNGGSCYTFDFQGKDFSKEGHWYSSHTHTKAKCGTNHSKRYEIFTHTLEGFILKVLKCSH